MKVGGVVSRDRVPGVRDHVETAVRQTLDHLFGRLLGQNGTSGTAYHQCGALYLLDLLPHVVDYVRCDPWSKVSRSEESIVLPGPSTVR